MREGWPRWRFGLAKGWIIFTLRRLWLLPRGGSFGTGRHLIAQDDQFTNVYRARVLDDLASVLVLVSPTAG